MIVEAQIAIDGSKETIWSVITDIENASESITGIDRVEVLERPKSGLVGLKWRETRTLFGKTATEDMWITDSSENELYKTRAESHGSIYISTRRLTDCQSGGATLTMTHESKPQGLVAKLLSIPMGFVFSRMLKKCLMQDLRDIKEAVEKRKSPQRE